MPTESLHIDTIVAGGDGLARRPGKPIVFVPRTAPGERVEVELTETRKQWTRARVLSVLEPSADRREASCPHYDACGGCQLQHLSYEAQLSTKARIIADALRRQGGVEIDPPEVIPSPLQLGYRNRVTFVLQRSDDGIIAGFHGLQKPGRIVDVDGCPLAEEPLNEAWKALRANWGVRAANLPSGSELRLTLRASSEGTIGLAVEGAEEIGEPEALLQGIERLESIWSVEGGGRIDWYAGEAWLRERWGEHEFGLAGLSFLQVNREAAAALDAYVLEQCGELSGRQVIDGYCGFGLRSLELAWAGARVVGIDTDADAIAAGEALAAESAATVRFVTAPLEASMPGELPADVVLLNPPRRGINRKVVNALLEKPPDRIVYVSCDPATLSRDVKLLSAAFQLAAVRGFDLFPQTAHVETVATLILDSTANSRQPTADS